MLSGFSTNDKSRFEDVLKENDAQTKKVCGNSYITSVAAAAIHHYRGIAKYALWRAKGALTAFATGLEFDSKHPGIEKCVQITKATMDGVKPSQHHDLIQCMLDTLPVGLLQTKIFKITKSPKDLQRERYTLKELRYCKSSMPLLSDQMLTYVPRRQHARSIPYLNGKGSQVSEQDHQRSASERQERSRRSCCRYSSTASAKRSPPAIHDRE